MIVKLAQVVEILTRTATYNMPSQLKVLFYRVIAGLLRYINRWGDAE